MADRGYFEHGADVGIFGRGRDVESAFCRAAESLFALTTDIATVKPRVEVAFDFEEPDVEMAFVRWLNLLLSHAADQGLALGQFDLARDGERWTGRAWGEPWHEALDRGTDVKGATLTMLSVTQERGTWDARCVVDV